MTNLITIHLCVFITYLHLFNISIPCRRTPTCFRHHLTVKIPQCRARPCLLICIWGVLCQKQVPRSVSSNYIPHIAGDVITYLWLWYLLFGTTFLKYKRSKLLKANETLAKYTTVASIVPTYIWDITARCSINREYPVKRALSAMRRHSG